MCCSGSEERLHAITKPEISVHVSCRNWSTQGSVKTETTQWREKTLHTDCFISSWPSTSKSLFPNRSTNVISFRNVNRIYNRLDLGINKGLLG